MSIHEQARAEAEKRWPTPDHRASQEEYDSAIASQGAFEDGAEWAAHRERCPHQKCPGGSLCCCTDQAATRTRVVTTVTELDALPVGSVVLDSGGGWTWTHVDDTERRDEEGDRLRRAWACVAYRSDRTAAEMFHGGGRRIGVGVGPFRVLYEPEEGR